MNTTKSLTVKKSDVVKIGNTVSFENGVCQFIADGLTANIEEILLRNILEIGGYSILYADEVWWDDDDVDIMFSTDMPKEVYEEWSKLND